MVLESLLEPLSFFQRIHFYLIIVVTADDAIENVLFLLKHRLEQKAKDSFAHEIKTLSSTPDEQSIIVEQAK
jgi:hypothetical protein